MRLFALNGVAFPALIANPFSTASAARALQASANGRPSTSYNRHPTTLLGRKIPTKHGPHSIQTLAVDRLLGSLRTKIGELPQRYNLVAHCKQHYDHSFPGNREGERFCAGVFQKLRVR